MHLTIQTKGHYDFIDITDQIASLIEQSKIKDGIVNIFIPGSTAAITTIEYEQGVIQDLKEVLEKIAPENYDYQHHLKWGDYNGAAHIKSALIKTSLTVPIENGKMQLGTWQQIVLIDFDEKSRTRKIIIKTIKQT